MIHHIRYHNRAHHRAEFDFQLFKHLVKIGVGAVQLVDKKDVGDAFFAGGAKALFGPHRDTAFAGQHDHRTAGGAHTLAQARRKIKQAGGIQKIHFGIFPFHRQQRGGNRCAPTNLFGVKITNGGAVRHATQTVGLAGQIKSRFRQRGLAAAGVPHQCYIANILGCVLFQCDDSSRIELILPVSAKVEQLLTKTFHNAPTTL